MISPSARAPIALVCALIASALLGPACTRETPPFESCFDPNAALPAPDPASPTYFADIKPVIDARCLRCHEPGGIAPFSLTTYGEVAELADMISASVVARTMPPFMAATCCAPYKDDFSLTDAQIALVQEWAAAGAPEGDPASPGAALPPIGGLSRVDVRLTVDEPYTVSPAPGRTDDFRCFLLEWPVERDVFVTGMNPVPSNRPVMHHLIAYVVEGQELDEARDLDAAAPGPGFPCEGGTGNVRTTGSLGGNLAGSDFPAGFGQPMHAGSLILLNVHYSISHVVDGDYVDQLSLELKIDDEAKPLRHMAVSQLLWSVGDAMLIEAGDADAVYRVSLEPTLFTRGRDVDIFGVTPHMHAYGSRVGVDILRKDGSSTCLLDIPQWVFGWTQPYYLAEPVRLSRGDKIRVECHFDNSPGRSPQEPRDIAWGEGDQDMCAAFLSFAFVEEE